MAIRNMSELRAGLRRGQRLLGLDLGEKTIGLALSDPGLSIASPLETIRRTKFTVDAQQLVRIIDKFDVGGLVLGLPVNMDGTEGPRCDAVREFARIFAQARAIDMAFWDERMSTMAVTRLMLDADLSRKRRGELVDKMAAAYILQGALDALNSSSRSDTPDE